MIQISPAKASDSNRIFEIFEKSRGEMTYLPSLHTSWETREFINQLVTNGGVQVAQIEGRIIGFIHTKDGWVHHLYVDPFFQNHGVGKALLDEVKKDNPQGLYLWVFEENTRAIKFYEREGFRLILKRKKDEADNEEGLPDRKYFWKT